MISKAKQEVPQVGKQYHFFDDGKITPSRHSIATVTRVVPFSEANSIIVKAREWDLEIDDPIYVDKPITEVWKNDVTDHDSIMNTETDYLIECSIPDYDENLIWFARTTEGGWFSMDIQSGWQAGRLDVDGKLYEYMCEYFCK